MCMQVNWTVEGANWKTLFWFICMWSPWETLFHSMQSIRNILAWTHQPGKGANRNTMLTVFLLFQGINVYNLAFSLHLVKTLISSLTFCRVCAQALLPTGQLLHMDCLLHAWNEPLDGGCFREREALHVQSMSHWAPANIGPYSQALRVSMETRWRRR